MYAIDVAMLNTTINHCNHNNNNNDNKECQQHQSARVKFYFIDGSACKIQPFQSNTWMCTYPVVHLVCMKKIFKNARILLYKLRSHYVAKYPHTKWMQICIHQLKLQHCRPKKLENKKTLFFNKISFF